MLNYNILAKTTLAFSLIGCVLTFDFLSLSESRRKSEFLDSRTPVFRGNETHRDYFKLLCEDSGSVLVGARNIIYNLSLTDLTEHVHERIHWSSSQEDRELCLLKGKGEDDCQNYIRVLARVDESTILVCGTNSYSPLCRHYKNTGSGYEMVKQFSGKGYSPYDPSHNSTALFTGGDLYAATVADFSATDSLIMKNQLRTEQYEYKQLNEPNFVSSLEDNNFVYFFFRESAVEFINCGKTKFSRVARVCKSDNGGTNKFKNRWTTFLKSRLNCSVPGEYPFYFDEIQATSNLYPTQGEDQIVYMVFTTPHNSIPGSAVCRFSLNSINSSFMGDFKYQESVNSNWLPVPRSQVPSPWPGTCRVNSSAPELGEPSLHFIKDHCLMDKPVNSDPQYPVFMRTGVHERFTKIAVDKDVVALDGSVFDILYIGTDNGRVLKVSVQSRDPSTEGSELLETVQLFPAHIPVRNLQIVRSQATESSLVVLTDDEVKSIPLEHCSLGFNTPYQGCTQCLALRSPYCGWDLQLGDCVPLSSRQGRQGILQDLVRGQHQSCPLPPVTTTQEPLTTTVDAYVEITSMPSTPESPAAWSTSTTETSVTTFPNYSDQQVCPACDCSCPSAVSIASQSDDINHKNILENTNILQDNRSSAKIESDGEDLVQSNEISSWNTLPLPVKEGSEVSVAGYSVSTLVLVSVMTGLVSLVLGFLAGYLFHRVLRVHSPASISSSSTSLVKPCPLDKPHYEDSGYNTPTTPGMLKLPPAYPPVTSSSSSTSSLPSTPSLPLSSRGLRNNNDSPCSTMSKAEESCETSVSLPPCHASTRSQTLHASQAVKRVYL